MILEACPTIADYGQPIRDAADIVAAGRYLRASLGAHESAWKEAVEEIGALKAGDTSVLTEKIVITYERMEVE